MESDLDMYLGDFLAVPARDVRYRETERVSTLLVFPPSPPLYANVSPFINSHLHISRSLSLSLTIALRALRGGFSDTGSWKGRKALFRHDLNPAWPRKPSLSEKSRILHLALSSKQRRNIVSEVSKQQKQCRLFRVNYKSGIYLNVPRTPKGAAFLLDVHLQGVLGARRGIGMKDTFL